MRKKIAEIARVDQKCYCLQIVKQSDANVAVEQLENNCNIRKTINLTKLNFKLQESTVFYT
jgi:hypothetical protein